MVDHFYDPDDSLLVDDHGLTNDMKIMGVHGNLAYEQTEKETQREKIASFLDDHP